MRFHIIVCDDEKITLKINCTYIEELAKKYKIDVDVKGFTSGEEVLAYIANVEIDIAFLDIDLKTMNGIALASMILKKYPKVATIFITGHREFAYDAFTVEAFSYLTKPIEQDRLERIFKKAIVHVNDLFNRKQRSTLIITEDNIKKKINQAIILYIERINNQSIIVTKTAKHGVYETLTSLEDRLEEYFIRVNQGIIVNLEEVENYHNNQIIMKSGDTIQVGRTYQKQVKKKFLEYPHS